MGGSGPGNSIATSGGCRTWPARFKCQWTSCASGRYEAGFARGRSRLEVCGPSGPMGGNDADCGSSWQTRVRASLRNKRLHEEYYQFRHLDPLYPFYLDRGSSIVTKEILCRADLDPWGAWVGDHPGLPGLFRSPGRRQGPPTAGPLADPSTEELGLAGQPSRGQEGAVSGSPQRAARTALRQRVMVRTDCPDSGPGIRRTPTGPAP